MKSREKENFWRHHITQAKTFDGSIAAYCRKHGLSSGTFKYWSGNIEMRGAPPHLPASRSSFVPVKIVSDEPVSSRNSLPDPKWIAEVLFEIHKRFQ